MSDRFIKLFSLPENLYDKNAPLIVVAGALHLDNKTGNCVAQLKMKNVSPLVIQGVRVRIIPFDVAGRPLNTETEYQYLDLSAHREELFGQNTLIELSDATTRAFEVWVLEVVFSDRTIWTPSETEWEPIPKQITLEDYLQDSELLKQYRIKFGSEAAFRPIKCKDIWLCTCGTTNKITENVCYKCDNRQDVLFAEDALDQLDSEKKHRLALEEERRIAEELRQKEDEERWKKEEDCRRAEEKAKEVAKINKRVKRLNWLSVNPALLFMLLWIILLRDYDPKGYFLALYMTILPIYLLVLIVSIIAASVAIRKKSLEKSKKQSLIPSLIFVCVDTIILWFIFSIASEDYSGTIFEFYIEFMKETIELFKLK